jgi:hypothetical protein
MVCEVLANVRVALANVRFVLANDCEIVAEVRSDALLTYALAQRLAKHRDTAAEMAPHVEDLQRALGRRRKAKPDQSSPEPLP